MDLQLDNSRLRVAYCVVYIDCITLHKMGRDGKRTTKANVNHFGRPLLLWSSDSDRQSAASSSFRTIKSNKIKNKEGMKTIPQMHIERWQSKSDRFILNGLLGINASQFFQGINPSSSSSSSVVVVNNMSRQETHQTDGSDVSVVLRELIISGALHSLLFFLALLGATHKINYSNNKEKRKKAGSTSSKKRKKTRKNLAGTRELPSSAHPRVHPPTQPITIIKKER